MTQSKKLCHGKHTEECKEKLPIEEWSRVSLLKGRKKTSPNTDLSLPKKYPDGHPVKTKKIEDIKKMIPYIPTEHHQFYEDLRDHVTAENVSEDEYEQ